MAFSGRFEATSRRSELEEIIDDDGESNDEYDSDDSECDPSYSIEEETNSKISRTSIRKKSKPLLVFESFDIFLTFFSSVQLLYLTNRCRAGFHEVEWICRNDVDMELIADADMNDAAPNENDEKDIHEVLQIIKGRSNILNCSVYIPLWFIYEQRRPVEIRTL